MTGNEKRQAVTRKYDEIIGRNLYSQPLRDYCYRKYSDGNYYSDCSSSSVTLIGRPVMDLGSSILPVFISPPS